MSRKQKTLMCLSLILLLAILWGYLYIKDACIPSSCTEPIWHEGKMIDPGICTSDCGGTIKYKIAFSVLGGVDLLMWVIWARSMLSSRKSKR